MRMVRRRVASAGDDDGSSGAAANSPISTRSSIGAGCSRPRRHTPQGPRKRPATYTRIETQWEDPRDDAQNRAWTRGLFESLHPFLERGVYVNNLNDGREEGGERIKDAYGPNFERLAALKRAYDPDNLFRLNHNIAPEPRRTTEPSRRHGG